MGKWIPTARGKGEKGYWEGILPGRVGRVPRKAGILEVSKAGLDGA